MHALVTLSCADDGRRSEIADALRRSGIELTESFDDLATIDIIDDSEGLLIRDTEEALIQLSASLPPDDIVGLARIALDITTLREVVRSCEDTESAGVIAANIAQEARDALVPVLFSADALACKSAAGELTNLLIVGLNRVMSVLMRITPVQQAGTTPPTCANTVISELAGTMRAIAQPAKVVTRLESPIPPVAIERTDLERMLLNLVANATEAQRILVATSWRSAAVASDAAAPAGDWIVVEVENDGATMTDEVREQVLRPSSPAIRADEVREPALRPSSPALRLSRPRALGLPSIARVTRAAGGHISIDNTGRGTKIEIWLPCVTDSVTT